MVSINESNKLMVARKLFAVAAIAVLSILNCLPTHADSESDAGLSDLTLWTRDNDASPELNGNNILTAILSAIVSPFQIEDRVELDPEFHSDQLIYSATVPYDVKDIGIFVGLNHSEATVEFTGTSNDGALLKRGSGSGNIEIEGLSNIEIDYPTIVHEDSGIKFQADATQWFHSLWLGQNKIGVAVTSKDRSTKRSYVVILVREAPDLEISDQRANYFAELIAAGSTDEIASEIESGFDVNQSVVVESFPPMPPIIFAASHKKY